MIAGLCLGACVCICDILFKQVHGTRHAIHIEHAYKYLLL